MRTKYIRLRILILGLMFTLGFAVIGGKALLLQVYDGPWLSRKATGQVEDSLKAVGKRGTIFDRRGHEMAVSIDVTSIAVRPPKVKDVDGTVKELARVLKKKPSEVKARLGGGKRFVWIKRQATPRETDAVKQLHLPGIEFVADSNRFYPNRTLAAHVLGFTGMDGKGMHAVGAPNLTDDVWLYGGDAATIRETVVNGRMGQMPAFADKLGEQRVRLLAAYVLRMSGSGQ